MNLFFFSLLSFTCNCIKVRFVFLLSLCFFSFDLFFILFLIFFSVLNNCMNVIVGFFFSYEINF